jgi:hypothetical protein
MMATPPKKLSVDILVAGGGNGEEKRTGVKG